MSVFSSHCGGKFEDEEDYGPLVPTPSGDGRLPVHPWLWVGLALVLLPAAMIMLMVLALGAGTAKHAQPGDPDKLKLPPGIQTEELSVPASRAR